MSVSPPPPTDLAAEARRVPSASPEARPRRPLARLAVVGALLAASGGVRTWQERRLDRALLEGRASPFPLAGLPTDLGPWKGRDVAMDPRIVRVAGGTDVVTRRYVDRRTGVALDVVILYGPASDMFIHTPELCYPSAGYGPIQGTFERPIAVDGAGLVPFRSLAFSKGEGGLADAQEVYYSLWYDGRWTTRSATPRASRRIPGMYKVQVSRRIAPRERRDLDNPCEPFLAALVGEVESRMARGRGPSSTIAPRNPESTPPR